MDYNVMAAKRRKRPFVDAPFVPFRGNTLLLICPLCNGLLGICASRRLRELTIDRQAAREIMDDHE